MTSGHHTTSSQFGEGFEPRDANTRAIAIAMVIGVVSIVASVAAMFMIVGAARKGETAGPPPTREQTMALTPPGPQLQSDPLRDIATLRRTERDALGAYRWLDDSHGAAQVPIARAMAMVVGRPLDPVTDAPPPGAAPGATSAPAPGTMPGTMP